MAIRQRKVEQVDQLTAKLRNAKVAVLTDYRGLTVAQMEDLRNKLRAAEVEFRVVKNTMARRAAAESGNDALQSELKGPIGIAFGYDDLGTPAKLLADWVRATRLKLEIVGGLVEGRVFGPAQVRQLADLPPREVLLAQLLGTLQSPVGQLVATVQAPVQQLVGLLEARKNQLEAKEAK
jgi:large subunit ribosomal protein L10